MTTTSTANDNNDSGDLNGQTFGNDSIEERVENDNNGKGKKKKNEDDKQGNGRKEQKKYQNATKALDALEVIRSKCSELFVDQIGEPYAAIKVRDHIETIPIRSNHFKDWIVKAYYDYRKEQQEKSLDAAEFDGKEEDDNNTIDDTTSPLLSNEDAAKIQTIIKLEAEELQNERKLEVRVAGNVDSDPDANDDNNIIWYDLTNRDWEIVKTTMHGWDIEKHGSHFSSAALPTILFKRYRNQLPQVYPSREYPPDIFSQFMDLTNLPKDDKENRILAEVYTIALFIPPDIPKTVLIPHGEQGAAKSTFQEFIKMLVDPCGALTLSFPKEVAELVQQLSHNFIAYYDNVSEIPQWISDLLCRAVTGSGFSKRVLFSDDDDFIYRFRRCVGFNGINVAATRPDLLERGLILHLKRIPEEKKRKLKHLWKQYERIKPQVLGFIFDTLVQVLNRLKEVQLKKYPRMADWAEICEVISRCLGYPENAFLNAYYKNIAAQNDKALESSLVATAIIKFIELKKEQGWKGTSNELLHDLQQVADKLNIDTRSKTWPKAPNILSRRINEIITNLREVGIIIQRPVDTTTNTTLIEIRKISPESPVSPETDNQAQNDPKNTGDTSGDTNALGRQVSPEKNNQNQAQNKHPGDTSDTGDTFHTSSSPLTSNTDVTTTKNNKLLQRYVAFDLEWSTDDYGNKKIYAAAFVDNLSISKVMHISDFNNSEGSLLRAIGNEITKYPLSIGWYTTGIEASGNDDDLAVFDDRCFKNNIDSKIIFNSNIPTIKGKEHIDLYQVFQKEMVKSSILNKYKSLKLGDVSKVLLGGKGKYDGISGANIHTKSIEEQKKYVLRDAELVMELSKLNNGQVLDLM